MIRLTKFDQVACAPTIPAREVLTRLNRSPYLFFIVLDEAGRLLGTITDGDVRRAILGGAGLDDPASRCMHREPVTGLLGADAGNLKLLETVPFLPVADEAGVIVEVLVPRQEPEGIRHAVVMAGGPGTRLGERTREVPKSLLPVGDKPILEHVLNCLEDAKVEEIFVAVHYLADQIEAFIAARNNRTAVRLIREANRLGTAGALSRMPQPLAAPVLVINGDVLTRVDFHSLKEFHHRHGYDGTIAVARHEVEVRFGVVYHDDGVFRGIDEKPTLHHFVAAGIYYLSPEFCALVPPNEAMDMPDLLNLGRSVGLRIGLFPIHEYWLDVGRPHDLEAAAREHGANDDTT